MLHPHGSRYPCCSPVSNSTAAGDFQSASSGSDGASAAGVPVAGMAAFVEVAELAVPLTGTGGFGGGGVAGQPAAMARVIIAKIDTHRAGVGVTRCVANMSILLGT